MMIRRLEARAAQWLERRRQSRMMRLFGCIQRCPWCRQIAQNGVCWKFDPWSDNAMCDVLTCGVCGGTSVWHFAVGMHAMGPLHPPAADPAFPNHLDALAAAQPRRDEGNGDGD